MWTELLKDFDPITLDEMAAIRLMNRTDTKFVTNVQKLDELLRMAEGEYRIQDMEGKRNMPYYTLYFDTPRKDMFTAHHNGRKTRQKVRIRSYLESGMSFLEVKRKNNHGRTEKKRVQVFSKRIADEGCQRFLGKWLPFSPDTLEEQIENRFHRITLVNRRLTERLTIDTGLRFRNLQTGGTCQLDDLVIIELKRDGRYPSPIREMLRRLRIFPSGFSKYCMGMALTDEALKKNRFKERLRGLERLNG